MYLTLIFYHYSWCIFQAQGKAALHLAAENGHLQVAEALLGKKAYVNARSKSGITPLHLACQNGYTRLVKLLIETHKANIESLSLVSIATFHVAITKMITNQSHSHHDILLGFLLLVIFSMLSLYFCF